MTQAELMAMTLSSVEQAMRMNKPVLRTCVICNNRFLERPSARFKDFCLGCLAAMLIEYMDANEYWRAVEPVSLTLDEEEFAALKRYNEARKKLGLA